MPGKKPKNGKKNPLPNSNHGEPTRRRAESPKLPNQFTKKKTNSVPATLPNSSAVEIKDIFNKDILKSLSLDELVQMLRQTNLRPNPTLTSWSEYRFDLLKDFHIESDVHKLEALGVKKETLAIIMMLINMAPGFDYCFGDLFGDKRSRLRQAKTLTRAADIMQMLSKAIGDAPEKMPALVVGPQIIIRGLQQYISMLTWGETICDFLGANSFIEVAKFSLAGLVRRTTNGFHDREVSALTGAALQNFDYDETAHRVWRIRTYPRLDKSCPAAPILLQAINTVLSRT